jgi:flagellar basal body rod protein FlgC
MEMGLGIIGNRAQRAKGELRMSSITNISSSALAAYSTRQAVTANNIANISTPNFQASDTVMKENKGGGVSATVQQGSDSVDISKEAVDMMVTSNGYGANLKALQASDQMMKDALNIVK